MIPSAHYARRRRQLLDRLARPAILFAGGERPRNYPANVLAYRADSSFLFFFGSAEPDAAALFDPGDGSVTLFLPERTAENALWSGPVPGFDQARAEFAVDRVAAAETLRDEVARAVGSRGVDALAVADSRTTRLAREVSGLDLVFDDPARVGPAPLIDAIAALRRVKEPAELDEIRRAAAVTRDAYNEIIAATRVGVTERELAARMHATFERGGGVAAYGTILSVRGETLHNPRHDGVLEDGDLLLVDAGAELASGYGADLTRTWPANGRFTPEQASIYDVVLASQAAAIAALAPGVAYRDVHLAAARVIAAGLAEIGLLRVSADDALESGAYAAFFPHGVGHMLGVDTHDLRIFGDRILYAAGRARSERFGENMLRFDLDLEPGMVVTIEPGIYFVPAILRGAEFRERFGSQVNWELAERYLAANDGRGFGGIRVEDNLLVTAAGSETLTAGIPKDRAALQAAIGTSP
ncbi:MAG: aminopeptidase P family protein [bacterium]